MHKGPRSHAPLPNGSLLEDQESGKMLGQPSQGIGDSPVPSCRVPCAAAAKGGNCVVTREGRRRGHVTASSITFIASFVVPHVFQKAPLLESTSASLDLVLELTISYNFQFSQVYLMAANSRRKSKATQIY